MAAMEVIAGGGLIDYETALAMLKEKERRLNCGESISSAGCTNEVAAATVAIVEKGESSRSIHIPPTTLPILQKGKSSIAFEVGQTSLPNARFSVLEEGQSSRCVIEQSQNIQSQKFAGIEHHEPRAHDGLADQVMRVCMQPPQDYHRQPDLIINEEHAGHVNIEMCSADINVEKSSSKRLKQMIGSTCVVDNVGIESDKRTRAEIQKFLSEVQFEVNTEDDLNAIIEANPSCSKYFQGATNVTCNGGTVFTGNSIGKLVINVLSKDDAINFLKDSGLSSTDGSFGN